MMIHALSCGNVVDELVMNKLVFFLLMIPFALHAQTFSVSGVVHDEHDNALEGVTVFVEPTGRITITNAVGLFSVQGLDPGIYRFTFSHVGYEDSVITINAVAPEPVFIHLRTAFRQLDAVVVRGDLPTLRRKEESLNIEVVNSSFIRKNLGGSLMQSLERLPGISTIGIGSGQSKPMIRGLGFNRIVVVDRGVKHEGQQWGADHGLEIDQFAVNDIDVLKGAASFVYGSDAIGGVIDIRPAPLPPLNTFGGSVDLVGKHNNNLYGTSVNLYGRKKAFFFDARVTHQDYGDYRVPAARVHVYDFPVDLYKNRLRNSAGDETDLHLSTGYVHDRVRSVFYISNTHNRSGFFANAHGLEPRQVDTDLHDRSARDQLYPRQEVNHFKVINRSSFQLGGSVLETELGYQHNFRQEFSQYVNHGYMPPAYPNDMTVPMNLEREFRKHVYSVNMRDYIWVGHHGFTIGVNGEYQDNAITGWSFLVPAFKQTTAGVFLYDKFQLNERILLHGAVRFDAGRIALNHYQDWFASETMVNGEPVSIYVTRAENLKRTFSSVVWSAGLNYSRGRFDVKANLGKSFRMPIAKELGANGVNYHYFSYERGNADLDPERSYQVDVGISHTDAKWSASVTPFVNYFSNYIYLNPTPQHDYLYGAGNQVFEYTQSKVLRYGGEVQAQWKIMPVLTAEVLGEYVYSRQLSGAKKGFTLPFSPPPSVLLNATWSPRVRGKFAEPFLSVDYRVVAQQNNIVPPEKETPGYNVMNVQTGTQLITKNGNRMTFNLQVQNLFDTSYMRHTSFYRLIGLPEMGRNIILSVSIPFYFKH